MTSWDVVAAVALCGVPLFNLLGYESSLVLAVLASLFAVRQGVHVVHKLRERVVHGRVPASPPPVHCVAARVRACGWSRFRAGRRLHPAGADRRVRRGSRRDSARARDRARTCSARAGAGRRPRRWPAAGAPRCSVAVRSARVPDGRDRASRARRPRGTPPAAGSGESRGVYAFGAELSTVDPRVVHACCTGSCIDSAGGGPLISRALFARHVRPGCAPPATPQKNPTEFNRIEPP